MPSIQHTLFRITVRNIQRTISYAPNWIVRIRKIIDTGSKFLTVPRGVKVRPTTIGDVPAEWLHPAGADKDKVMLFLHGGGYTVGSIQTHRGLAARIAQLAGIRGLIIDYRLAPEHPFPAGLEDAVHVYKCLLNQGYDPGNIVIVGDSAGGGLTIATQLVLREMNLPLPAASVCLSPWVDLEFTGKSVQEFQKDDPIVRVDEVKVWSELYAGTHSLQHPLISPLHADLSGLPPMLIQGSEKEVLASDAKRLAKKIKAAGGRVQYQTWPETLHVWQLFWKMIPESEEAVQKIAAFVREHAQMGISSQSLVGNRQSTVKKSIVDSQ